MLKSKFDCGLRIADCGFGGFKLCCLLLTAICLLLMVGCRYDMQDQPKYKAYRKSEFFKDGSSARPLIVGTVPRGFLREDKALYTGKKDGPPAQPSTDPNAIGAAKYPNDVEEFPFPITEEVIARGKRQYQIFCIVCHGPTGNGDGMVVRRGFKQPPSFHTEDLRKAPVGHFFDVETNGWGVMKSYAAQVPVTDRWSIISYIRVLQKAQETEEKKEGNANTSEANRPAATNSNTQQNNNRQQPTTQRRGGNR
jgi:mono/diheme cytochrome c family protein